MTSIAFDSTSFIHFARAGRLPVLQAATGNDDAVLLAEVENELARGALHRPSLDDTTRAWLKPTALTEMSELAAFASYKTELGGGQERNNGEAAVLAWVSVSWVAAAVGDRARLDELLGAAPSADDVNHAFWQACHGGQLRIARHLRAMGADIGFVPEYSHQTALQVTVSPDTRQQALETWLRDQGATPGESA